MSGLCFASAASHGSSSTDFLPTRTSDVKHTQSSRHSSAITPCDPEKKFIFSRLPSLKEQPDSDKILIRYWDTFSSGLGGSCRSVKTGACLRDERACSPHRPLSEQWISTLQRLTAGRSTAIAACRCALSRPSPPPISRTNMCSRQSSGALRLCRAMYSTDGEGHHDQQRLCKVLNPRYGAE